jgi:hypothetical protein
VSVAPPTRCSRGGPNTGCLVPQPLWKGFVQLRVGQVSNSIMRKPSVDARPAMQLGPSFAEGRFRTRVGVPISAPGRRIATPPFLKTAGPAQAGADSGPTPTAQVVQHR